MCLVTKLCLNLCNPMDCSSPGSSVHEDSPGKNTGVGCHALLQGIFPTQESAFIKVAYFKFNFTLSQEFHWKVRGIYQDLFYLSGDEPKLSPIAPGKCQELCSTS